MAKKFKLKGKHLLGPGVGNEVTLYPMTVADNVTMEKDGTLYSIQEAVNNGAFNGKDGEDGKPGPQGPMGDTSIVTSDGTINVEQTLSNSTGKVPSSHAVHEHVETHYAQKNGFYEEMAVGLAENIISPDGKTDTEPYIFRSSAGDVSISTGNAEIEKLEGNSVVKNQLIDSIGYGVDAYIVSHGNGRFKLNGALQERHQYFYNTTPLIVGHKYFISFVLSNGSYNDGAAISIENIGFGLNIGNKSIWERRVSSLYPVVFAQGTFNNAEFSLINIDLTKWYNGNIPSDLTAEKFIKENPDVLTMGYTEPRVVNVNPTSLKTTGFNQFDEVTEQGQISAIDGSNIGGSNVRAKNFIKIVKNQDYFYSSSDSAFFYFYDSSENYLGTYQNGNNGLVQANNLIEASKIPSGAAYMRFVLSAGYGTSYMHDVNINIAWSGYRNGDYEPHVKHNIPIPINQIVDDGYNVMFPDGLVRVGDVADVVTPTYAIKRVGVVDLGILNWEYQTEYKRFRATFNYPYLPQPDSTVPNILMLGYDAVEMNETNYESNKLDHVCSVAQKSTVDAGFKMVYAVNSSFASASDCQAAMQGVKLYYELAYPIEVHFNGTHQPFGEIMNLTYAVDDFGTEEFIGDTAPVHHETLYMRNLRDELRDVPNRYATKVELANLDEKKADKNGHYEGMTVLAAENLIGKGAPTAEEFTYRIAGGSKSIEDGIAKYRSVKGNSVIKNQYVDMSNEDIFTPTHYGYQRSYPVNIKQGDKFFFTFESYGNISLLIGGEDAKTQNSDTYQFAFGIYNATIVKNSVISLVNAYLAPLVEIGIKNLKVVSLTQWYNGNVPEGLTAEDFIKMNPDVLTMPYTEPHIVNMTAEKVVNTGRNLWDEEWEVGRIDPDSGANIADSTTIRSKNFIGVSASKDYYIKANHSSIVVCYDSNKNGLGWVVYGGSVGQKFTTKPNTAYVKFCLYANSGNTYNNDIAIFNYVQGMSTDYEPHITSERKWTETMKKCFPDGMAKAGNVYDEMGSTKAVKRIAKVEFDGTENWQGPNGTSITCFLCSEILKGSAASSEMTCAHYRVITGSYDNMDNKTIGHNSVEPYNRILFCKDDDYADVAAWKSHLASLKAAGNPLTVYYPLAEPIVTTYDELNLTSRVWRNGMEEIIVPEGKESSPISADIKYNIDYPSTVDRLHDEVGLASALQTASKSTLVAAINELVSRVAALEARPHATSEE